MTAHALFIGTDQYVDKNVPHLHCAQHDASELYNLFKRELGYGSCAQLLLAPKLEEVFETLDGVGRQVRAGDSFLLYFAGHGVEAANGQDQYLLLSGARMVLLNRAHGTPAGTLSVSDLVAVTDQWPAVQRVMVFDACRTPLVSSMAVGVAALGGVPVFGSEEVLRRIATRDPLAHLAVDDGQAPTSDHGAGRRPSLAPPVFIKSCQSQQVAVELLGERRSMFGLAFDEVLQEARRQGKAVLANDGLLRALAHHMDQLAKKHGVGGGQQPWMSAAQGQVALYVPPMQKTTEPLQPDKAGQEAATAKAAAEAAVAAVDARLLRAAEELDTEAAWLALYTHANDTGLRQRASQRLAEFQKKPEPPPVLEPSVPPVRPVPPVSPATPQPPQRSLGKLGRGVRILGGGMVGVWVALIALGSWSERKQSTGNSTQTAPTAAVVAPVRQRAGYEPEMVVIPAGQYMMGSPSSEPGRSGREGPQRRVNVKSFELGKTEVTQGQWKAVMGSNPSHFKACGDSCPVEKVSWEDVQKYLQALNQKVGLSGAVGYRLPSEAEWEYAARAGCSTAFNAGGQCADKIEPSQANFNGNSSFNGSGKGAYLERTQEVGRYAANNWGLQDMHGNVWEWVQDCYEVDYSKGQPTDGGAHRGGDSSCSRRVLRGGSRGDVPRNLRSASRDGDTPGIRYYDFGFRIARTVP